MKRLLVAGTAMLAIAGSAQAQDAQRGYTPPPPGAHGYVPPPPPMHGPGWGGGNYRPGPWRLLAFKAVRGGTDHDTIRVSNRRLYRQLQLCSINAPLHIIAFDATFDNGGRQNFRVAERLGAGSCTRPLDLRGRQARAIYRIDMTYQQIDRSMRVPVVRVMGR